MGRREERPPAGRSEGAGGGCCGIPTSSLPQGDLRQRFIFFLFFSFFSERELTQFSKAAGNGGVLGLGEVGWFRSITWASTVPRGMASSATRNVEKKGSGQSQATTSAASLGGGPVSIGEEFLGWG